MFFNQDVRWDEPAEPGALTCIRLFGKFIEKITGKPQHVEGNSGADSYNNFDNPTKCRVIANSSLIGSNYTLWAETRVAVDGPGDYGDKVSFECMGCFSDTYTE